jgi:hypothetical protein
MIDTSTKKLKMVEYNTVASSFGNLSERIRKAQNFMVERYRDDLEFNYPVEDITDP